MSVDEARLMPRFRSVFQRVEMGHSHAKIFAAEVNRAVSAGVSPSIPTRKVPAGGDPAALRGIPVIGRGVGGTSPGTRPG